MQEQKYPEALFGTVYQLIDDASRFDVGSRAFQRHENSQDAQEVLVRAIAEFGAPQEVLSDNSKAFNQLRSGTFGSVEMFLASKGSMPITGLPGRPTIQGKNERSHRTLKRFLTVNKPQDPADVQRLLKRYREHYNKRRPHQSLNQATPQAVWELLEHTPATEPIHLSVLEAKAAEYLSKRRLAQSSVRRLDVVVSKSKIRLFWRLGAGQFRLPGTAILACLYGFTVFEMVQDLMHPWTKLLPWNHPVPRISKFEPRICIPL